MEFFYGKYRTYGNEPGRAINTVHAALDEGITFNAYDLVGMALILLAMILANLKFIKSEAVI